MPKVSLRCFWCKKLLISGRWSAAKRKKARSAPEHLCFLAQRRGYDWVRLGSLKTASKYYCAEVLNLMGFVRLQVLSSTRASAEAGVRAALEALPEKRR